MELEHMLFLGEIVGIRAFVKGMHQLGMNWRDEYRRAAAWYNQTWALPGRPGDREPAPPEALVDPTVDWPSPPPGPQPPYSR